MNKREFAYDILKKLEKSMGEDYELSIQEKETEQGIKKTGIIIHNNNAYSSISPIIYVDNFFEDFENMKISIEQATMQIEKAYNHAINDIDTKQENFSKYTEYSYAKDKLDVRMIDSSIDETKGRPFANKNGFNVYPVIVTDLIKSNDGVGVMPITDQLLTVWGMSIEEVVSDAINNLPKINNYQLNDMNDIIMGIMAGSVGLSDSEVPKPKNLLNHPGNIEITPTNSMFVITNEKKFSGSNVLFVPEIMEKVSEKLNGDYYILPSSRHEIIVIPAKAMESDLISPNGVSDLADMVQEVNGTEVEKVDLLSYRVFKYDSKTKTVIEAVENKTISDDTPMELAKEIDAFQYDFDTYEYKDTVNDRNENILSLSKDIIENPDKIVEGLKNMISEAESEDVDRAETLINKIENFEKKESNKEIDNAKRKSR